MHEIAATDANTRLAFSFLVSVASGMKTFYLNNNSTITAKLAAHPTPVKFYSIECLSIFLKEEEIWGGSFSFITLGKLPKRQDLENLGGAGVGVPKLAVKQGGHGCS